MLSDLLNISNPSLGSKEVNLVKLKAYLFSFGIEDESYIELIRLRNGFLAFESALTVYPYDNKEDMNLEEWNELRVWKENYSFINKPFICFAQDIFGFQFCLTEEGIEIFDPETGEFEYLTDNIESWVNLLLKDYECLTGFTIAHEWQRMYGKIGSSTTRLSAKIPFILGGKYELSNLYMDDVYRITDFRSNLARQIYGLEDGQAINIKIL